MIYKFLQPDWLFLIEGNFNITVPFELLNRTDGVLAIPDSENVQQDGERSYSDESEEVIPETQHDERLTDQGQHIVYELPMRPVEDQSMEVDENIDDPHHDFHESQTGRTYRDKSNEHWHGDEVEFNQKIMKSERASNHGEKLEKSTNVRDARTVEDNEKEFDEIYERYRARDGRWSEGHEVNEKVHRNAHRYSEGLLGNVQRSAGHAHHLNYLGNDPFHPILSNSPKSLMEKRLERSHDLMPSARRSLSPAENFEELFSYQQKLMSQSLQSHVAVQDGDNRDSQSISRTSNKQHFDDMEEYRGQVDGNGHYNMHRDVSRGNMASSRSGNGETYCFCHVYLSVCL